MVEIILYQSYFVFAERFLFLILGSNLWIVILRSEVKVFEKPFNGFSSTCSNFSVQKWEQKTQHLPSTIPVFRIYHCLKQKLQYFPRTISVSLICIFV